MTDHANHHLRFPLLSRLLHWLMAAMIIAMLFIGIGMVASLSDYHWLVSIHKPLGVAILILAAIRLVNRQLNPPPPLPAAMPDWQKKLATGSHVLLYFLMFALPLIGWGMLSAGEYPIVLYGAWHLPPILPHSAVLYSILRTSHTVLALVFFAVIIGHFGAAMLHALIFRDGVFQAMAGGRTPAGAPRTV